LTSGKPVVRDERSGGAVRLGIPGLLRERAPAALHERDRSVLEAAEVPTGAAARASDGNDAGRYFPTARVAHRQEVAVALVPLVSGRDALEDRRFRLAEVVEGERLLPGSEPGGP